MIAMTISGNLVVPPKFAFNSAKGGAVYSIRIGSNTMEKKKGESEMVKVTYWASGLVYEKKIKSILPYLKKGTYIVCHCPSVGIQTYQGREGKEMFSIDLRFIQTLEAGNLDRGDQQQPQVPQRAQPPQVPQAPQYPTHSQPAQPPKPQQPLHFDPQQGYVDPGEPPSYHNEHFNF